MCATILEASIYTRRFLLNRQYLDALQHLLKRMAPQWAASVRIVYDEHTNETSERIDVDRQNTLCEAIRVEIERPPSKFARQIQEYRKDVRPQYQRTFGMVQLRGAHDDLVVFVDVDEYPISPRSGAWDMNNRVSIEVRDKMVEGRPAVEWTSEAFERLVATFPVDYGYAWTNDEYCAKNISYEGGGMRAVGRDIARYLPGLYWLNFFGRVYVDSIGEERLLSAPCKTRQVDAGVLLFLHDDPFAWKFKEYAHVEQEVLDHIGREYCFDRQKPDRETVAPEFEFPSPS